MMKKVRMFKCRNVFYRAGTIGPAVLSGGSAAIDSRDFFEGEDVRRYLPWLPMWFDVNIIVPVAATVVVIIVGIVVICVALSRRGHGPEQTRLRGISSGDEKYYEGQCIEFSHEMLILTLENLEIKEIYCLSIFFI